IEVVELIPRALLLRRETGGWRVTVLERPRNICRYGGRHVGVDADQFRRSLQRHLLGDGIPPVAALRYKAGVPQTLHQHDPGTGDTNRIPAGRSWLPRKPMPRQRRNHQMEGILRSGAVASRIGERTDDLELLDDRARPPVRHDERQRTVMFRAHMDEV